MEAETPIVKTDFDFGWKSGINPIVGDLTLKYNKGDILDVGCGTCQLYAYLRDNGWKGRYTGIDIQKHEGCVYPDVDLVIGDALKLEFPKVDTCVLYNILEHINSPVELLAKALKTAQNTLINIPKRNEELWKFSVAEFHQLDKTHKHCGFTKEEVYELVERSGGRIVVYKELFKVDIATLVRLFWKNEALVLLIKLLAKLFPPKGFYQEIWCEVEPKEN